MIGRNVRTYVLVLWRPWDSRGCCRSPCERLPRNTAVPDAEVLSRFKALGQGYQPDQRRPVLLNYTPVSGLSEPVFIPFLKTNSLSEYYAYCIHFALAGRLTADG